MKNPPRAILFCGILYADESFRSMAVEALVLKFGPLRLESGTCRWHSSHYSDELGTPVMRQFLFFRDTVGQDILRDAKNETRSMEKELSRDGKRKVNLDPGIIAPARVVLATTKDYAHRIYLGDGIFAETTLLYRRGSFVPSEFAYDDYTQEDTVGLFVRMRNELLGRTGKQALI